jgi:hypothetical protein
MYWTFTDRLLAERLRLVIERDYLDVAGVPRRAGINHLVADQTDDADLSDETTTIGVSSDKSDASD